MKPNYADSAKEWPRPCGHYILIEMPEYNNETDWGFQTDSKDQSARQQQGMEVGYVRAIGPTAYTGFAGFDEGSESWGVKVGDKVEFKRYEGHGTAAETFELFHYIPDSLIIGVLESDDE